MKTKIIKLVIVQFFFCASLQAQIPNADFENWTFFGWFYNPDGWTTNNNQIQSTFVSPDSDSYNGMLAMLLYNYNFIRPVAKTKFPATSNVNSLDAYVKLKLIPNDTVTITLRELNNGVVVDSGYWMGVSDILNYQQINIPVSQNNASIDTIEIEINGGNQNNLIFEGTKFEVDYLQLNQPSAVIECSAGLENFQAFPNPVNEIVFLNSDAKSMIKEIRIIDIKGKMVNQILEEGLRSNHSGLYEINVAGLPTGIYIAEFKMNSGTKSCKFIKQ